MLAANVVTVAGISIENLFALLAKANCPIDVTPLGTTALPVQPLWEITVLF